VVFDSKCPHRSFYKGSIANVLRRYGLPPAPRRAGPGWTEFLRTQAKGIMATDRDRGRATRRAPPWRHRQPQRRPSHGHRGAPTEAQTRPSPARSILGYPATPGDSWPITAERTERLICVVAQRSCRDQRQYINTYRGHETFLHHCAVLREGIAAGQIAPRYAATGIWVKPSPS